MAKAKRVKDVSEFEVRKARARKKRSQKKAGVSTEAQFDAMKRAEKDEVLKALAIRFGLIQENS